MKTSWTIKAFAATSLAAFLGFAGSVAGQQAPSSTAAAPATDPTVTASATNSATSAAKNGKAASAKSAVVCPLSVGTAFNAKLLETLDARRNKSGDTFTAETTETVRYGRSIIFPRGTIIEGHVVRKSISTHGPDRAALFLQFDRAILKGGQDTVMNAGIQALAVGPMPPANTETAMAADDDPDAPARSETPAGSYAQPLDANLNTDGANKNMVAVSHGPAENHAQITAPPVVDLPLTQGAFTKRGLLTSDSKGALGAPDIRVYTPLSEGSDGTVLMTTRKNVHLERGTRLLIVIQPPRVSDTTASN